MKRFLRFSLIIFMLFSTSFCGNQNASSRPASTNTPNYVRATIPANATPTPTAFQPLPITPTNTPDPDSILTTTPGPVSTNDGTNPNPYFTDGLSIPPPVSPIVQSESVLNILLLGSDQRPNDGGFRTDAIILVSINTETSQVSMLSFPRDLYIYIPGWTLDRINTVHSRGGFPLTQEVFLYNFGIQVDHYVLINFSGFVDMVDTLGGIDVQVGAYIADHRDGYGIYAFNPGLRHMDGETALWYVRARYTTSDFDRTRRQQEVIQATYDKLLSLDTVNLVPDLYRQFQRSIRTSFTLDEILFLLPAAMDVQSNGSIQSYAIGSEHVIPWTNPYSGAQVLLPNTPIIQQLIQQALINP